MAICNTCQGTGRIASSGYEACGGCGGLGKMGAADSCSYCGGSGKSSTPAMETCYNCNGSGAVSDPAPRDPSPTTSSTPSNSNKPTTKKDDGNPLQQLIGIGVFIAVAISLYQPEEENGIVSLIIAIVAGCIAAAIYKFIAFVGVVLVIVYFYSESNESSNNYSSESSSSYISETTTNTSNTTLQNTIPLTNMAMYINNQCHRKVSIALTYRDENLEWQTTGWWNFEGNVRQYLIKNNKALALSLNEVYLYAEVPNSNISWSGEDYKTLLDGRTLDMMKLQAFQNAEAGYEVRLHCNNL